LLAATANGNTDSDDQAGGWRTSPVGRTSSDASNDDF
jgi:hypothetical protein